MENWVEIQAAGDEHRLADRFGISPITARILLNRGINEEGIKSFLSPSLNDFHDPFMLSGMERVVLLVKEALKAGSKIRIIGDYDVDGITATLIFYKGLTFFGGDVDCVIPHRIEDGYGINQKLIDNAASDGRDMIITCDNGIAAFDEVKHAKDLGLQIIVTDHHEVPYEENEGIKSYRIPEADAVVDPKLPDDEYPFKGICGAFVAYKVIWAMGVTDGIFDTPGFQDLMGELTEFAALATVCDVMELKDENRSLVSFGTRLMARSRNAGLSALIEETGLKGKVLTPYHLGFVIGPCLNASGRLDTSLRALSLFTETDPDSIRAKARDLCDLNEERKAMTQEWTQKALETVEAAGYPDKVIVLYLKGCHESLAGIIAGKVRERFVRPTYVLTDAENGIKGSGRSIDAYDMYEGLTKVSDLLSKFGGHKLAAGVSMDPINLEAFRKRLNDDAKLSEEDFKETVRVDAELSFCRADMALMRELNRLQPYGVGNPTPVFKTEVTILSGFLIGKNKNFAKYKVLGDDKRTYEMVFFGNITAMEEYVRSKCGEASASLIHTGRDVSIPMEVLYTAEINTFKGTQSVQFQLKYYR